MTDLILLKHICLFVAILIIIIKLSLLKFCYKVTTQFSTFKSVLRN